MKTKFRIVSYKRKDDGQVRYVVEQSVRILFWKRITVSYPTYEEALERLEYYTAEELERAVLLKECKQYGTKVHKVVNLESK